MKQPRQARSHASRDRIVDAAEALLAERGLAGLSVAAVLGRAGVSVGAFYARFGGKPALVRHLGERFWARARDEWADRLDPARWIGQSAAAIVERVVGDAVGAHRRQWAELRALVEYGLSAPEAHLLKQARELDGFVAGRLSALLLARRAEIAHPEPAIAVELGYLQLVGTLRTLVLVGWPRRDWAPLADATMAAELTRAYLAYLGVRYK